MLRITSQQFYSKTHGASVWNEIVGSFKAPIKFSVAYGSGAVEQRGYESAKAPPMIDFIFGVDNSREWHEINLEQNRAHYSGVARMLGPATLQHSGAGLYYNTNCTVSTGTGGSRQIKYGVIEMRDLLNDLREWRTLYVAGRLQKPVRTIVDNVQVTEAQTVNLMAVANVAMLQLPEKFTARSLMENITRLSYTSELTVEHSIDHLGDFRTLPFVPGENPNKVHNIVDAQFDAFVNLYTKQLSDKFGDQEYQLHSQLHQDTSPDARMKVIRKLPQNFRRHLVHRLLPEGNLNVEISCLKLIFLDISNDRLKMQVNRALRDTGTVASLVQGLKGVVTAGPLEALTYTAKKIRKYFKK